MKNMSMLVAVLVVFAVASCGGSSSSDGGGGDTPTPTATGTNTKVVSKVTVEATQSAMGSAAVDGLQNLDPTLSVSASTVTKEAVSADINHTYYCTVDGSVLATKVSDSPGCRVTWKAPA